jgi:hypothetical protein
MATNPTAETLRVPIFLTLNRVLAPLKTAAGSLSRRERIAERIDSFHPQASGGNRRSSLEDLVAMMSSDIEIEFFVLFNPARRFPTWIGPRVAPDSDP